MDSKGYAWFILHANSLTDTDAWDYSVPALVAIPALGQGELQVHVTKQKEEKNLDGESQQQEQERDQEGKLEDDQTSWSSAFIFFFFAIVGGCIFYNYFVKKYVLPLQGRF